eukprot:5570854-Amphidinium_carterae.1
MPLMACSFRKGVAQCRQSFLRPVEDVEHAVVDGDQDDEAVEIMEADFYDDIPDPPAVAPPLKKADAALTQAQRLLALRLVYGVTAPSV